MNYQEQFDGALACNTKEEADLWMAKEIERYKTEYGQGALYAEFVIKTNLGYMAGYYDREVAQKIHQLFGAVHPIFGTADYHGKYTPEQLLEMGKAFGEAAESAAEARRKR